MGSRLAEYDIWHQQNSIFMAISEYESEVYYNKESTNEEILERGVKHVKQAMDDSLVTTFVNMFLPYVSAPFIFRVLTEEWENIVLKGDEYVRPTPKQCIKEVKKIGIEGVLRSMAYSLYDYHQDLTRYLNSLCRSEELQGKINGVDPERMERFITYRETGGVSNGED